MSIRVMSQVWEIELPDSEKLVLLALADSANDEGACWPSMRTLAGKCSKSDRTVQAAIKLLVEKGHLSRIEVPGKGCRYYVHPVMPTGMQGTNPVANHYTYRITCTETGEFYVGARSTYDPPEADSYMGSGAWIKEAKAAGLSLRKEVVATYPSREALGVGEQELSHKVVGHPLCRNKKVASARNLPPHGGLRPEVSSPRSDFAPQGTNPTPEANDADPRSGFGQTVKNHQEPSEVKSADTDHLTPADILEGWNELAASCGLPKAGKLTGGRLRQAKARIREYPDLDDWRRAFKHIRDTPFLRGTNDRGWRADIDFLLQAKSFTKLTEGSYGQAN